jgi:hypothetical protein
VEEGFSAEFADEGSIAGGSVDANVSVDQRFC